MNLYDYHLTYLMVPPFIKTSQECIFALESVGFKIFSYTTFTSMDEFKNFIYERFQTGLGICYFERSKFSELIRVFGSSETDSDGEFKLVGLEKCFNLRSKEVAFFDAFLKSPNSILNKFITKFIRNGDMDKLKSISAAASYRGDIEIVMVLLRQDELVEGHLFTAFERARNSFHIKSNHAAIKLLEEG